MAEIVTSNADVFEYSSPVEYSLLCVLELVSRDAVCEANVHWLVTGPSRFYLGAEWQKEEIQIQFSLLHGKLQTWSNSAAEFMKNRVLLRAGQALLPLVLLCLSCCSCVVCVWEYLCVSSGKLLLEL